MEKICWENANKIYDAVTDVITQRLAYELEIIQSMQFSDYFLIVWDFIAYAKRKEFWLGRAVDRQQALSLLMCLELQKSIHFSMTYCLSVS